MHTKGHQKLKEYMRAEGMTSRDLTKVIGGISIFAVRKWMTGERTPRDHLRVKIARITDGAVQIQDWAR